jgi:hypothetical protein
MAKVESPAAKQFMSKLQSGQYSDLANAKRAIGRAVNVTADEKAACLKAAEKTFSGAPRQPAAKNGKAKAVVKKKVARQRRRRQLRRKRRPFEEHRRRQRPWRKRPSRNSRCRRSA